MPPAHAEAPNPRYVRLVPPDTTDRANVSSSTRGTEPEVPLRNLGGPSGTGLGAPAPGGFKHGMRAFRHRDFRLFFGGALVSNTGNWLQNLTVPFVLFELTQSAFWVGLATFAQFIPAVVLGPLGGSLADRHRRRTVLLISQTLMAVAAAALWIAWAGGVRNPTAIVLITATTGVFSGVMVPAWQAFVPSLVPREDLRSAITLNSTQFNAARAFGPALAGILLATLGPSWAFLINTVSFVAVIAALWLIRPATSVKAAAPAGGILRQFVEALRYVRSQPGIWLGIVASVLVAALGNPVTQFTVVFAETVYQAEARILGLLAAAIGIGAVVAAPFLSAWEERISRADAVRWGLPAYGVAITAFGLSGTWPIGFVALLFVGGGFLAVIASSNTAVQIIVADRMRGRVMATRVMAFTAAFPIGALIQGWLIDLWGPRQTISAAGLLLTAIALGLATRPGLLARLNDGPDQTEVGP